jgi:crotonobetainyl-CoA:carnitine CoA-transferase CaiB-like acyl-CoA transferase
MRADWRRLDAPGLGEHSAEILAELGVEPARLESLRKDGVV